MTPTDYVHRDVLIHTMIASVGRFAEYFDRLPDDHEAQIIWAAVQRYHGIPERYVEPPELRRQ